VLSFGCRWGQQGGRHRRQCIGWSHCSMLSQKEEHLYITFVTRLPRQYYSGAYRPRVPRPNRNMAGGKYNWGAGARLNTSLATILTCPPRTQHLGNARPPGAGPERCPRRARRIFGPGSNATQRPGSGSKCWLKTFASASPPLPSTIRTVPTGITKALPNLSANPAFGGLRRPLAAAKMGSRGSRGEADQSGPSLG
jgi:hypothetical protein